MIYDFAIVINTILCIYSALTFVAVLSRSRKKDYEPPSLRKRYIFGILSLLALPSISLGFIAWVFYTDIYRDPTFLFFGTMACLALLLISIQFSIISKEETFSIKNAHTENSSII